MTRSLILLAALAVAAPATAQSFQATTLIDRAVASFTGHGIGEEGGARTPVDPRLKLATCPMVAMAWYGDAHDAVAVSCTAPDWRIFVPVRQVPVTAPVASPALVPPRPAAPVIRRGDPVTIEAGAAGFSISRDGIAMADAAPGARFAVKVEDAKGPVQAVALESGRATLPGWNNN